MKTTLPRVRSLLFALLTLGIAGSATASTPFHFVLVKSLPADKATVHHAADVKLWFSEAPADYTMSVNVLDAAGDPMETGDPVQDAEDEKAFTVAFPQALASGAYTVVWRGMGSDGHVVRGEFAFTVAGH